MRASSRPIAARISTSASLARALAFVVPLVGCSGSYLPVDVDVDEVQGEPGRSDATAPPVSFDARESLGAEVDTFPVLSGRSSFEGTLNVRSGFEVGTPGNIVCAVDAKPHGVMVDVTCTFTFRRPGSKVILLGLGSNPSGSQGDKVNVELACIRQNDTGPCATYHLERKSPLLRALLQGKLWATVRTEWWPEGELQGALR